jgi:hypothetical protein
MAAIPITMAKIPAINGRSAAEISGKMSSRIPKIILKIPRIPFPASFRVNASNRWTHPVKHAQKPTMMIRNVNRITVLYSGWARIMIPTRRFKIARTIFHPRFVRSTARLASEKIPPTSQYAPRKVMKITVVMPGVVRNIIPIIRARNPQIRTSHQGKSPGAILHPHEHPHGSGVAVVSAIKYLKLYI